MYTSEIFFSYKGFFSPLQVMSSWPLLLPSPLKILWSITVPCTSKFVPCDLFSLYEGNVLNKKSRLYGSVGIHHRDYLFFHICVLLFLLLCHICPKAYCISSDQTPLAFFLLPVNHICVLVFLVSLMFNTILQNECWVQWNPTGNSLPIVKTLNSH